MENFSAIPYGIRFTPRIKYEAWVKEGMLSEIPALHHKVHNKQLCPNVVI